MLLLINSHHLRQPRRFAAVGPNIALARHTETEVGLMKVEVSLFAGLLVIATTLLARAQIQGLEGARVREFSATCRVGLAKRRADGGGYR